MRLFTIGDSISQGFMSLAAAKTELCYSTILAECLGLKTGCTTDGNTEYIYPDWPANGLPFNMEAVLRCLERRYDRDIKFLEWIGVPSIVNSYLDTTEKFYECTDLYKDKPYHLPVKHFHNVSVFGNCVHDAWMLTPELCKTMIKKKKVSDDYFEGPSSPRYRTALRVLDPMLNGENRSALDWLKYHCENEGVENIIIWLGANNALGTLLKMKINEFNTADPLNESYEKRDSCNLWSAENFETDFRELIRRVNTILDNPKNKNPHTKVFIGTVPLVTIAPLAKGVGCATPYDKKNPDNNLYFESYSFVFFSDKTAAESQKSLSREDVIKIDERITGFNNSIENIINEQGNNNRYYKVDICEALLKMAFRRNNGHPTYEFPSLLKQQLLYNPTTLYYRVDRNGKIYNGGLFSLDGVHPTVIGQGIIAHEFRKVMEQSGVVFTKTIDWKKIVDSDTLTSYPLRLIEEMFQHDTLIRMIVRMLRWIR